MMNDTDKRKKHADYMRLWRARRMAANPEAALTEERRIYRQKVARKPELYRRLGRERMQRHRSRLGSDYYTEEVLASNRRRNRLYKLRHKDRLAPLMAARGRARYARNPEHGKALARKYQQSPNGRAVVLAANRRRRALERGAPGVVTAAQWRTICEVDGWKCEYCGKALTEKTATMDHVIPLTKGGEHDPGNIVPACRSCNSRKGNRLFMPKAA